MTTSDNQAGVVNLFQLHARCQRSELAVEMVGGPREHHLVFDPMPYAECEAKLTECLSYIQRPDDWNFTIEPTANEGCRA